MLSLKDCYARGEVEASQNTSTLVVEEQEVRSYIILESRKPKFYVFYNAAMFVAHGTGTSYVVVPVCCKLAKASPKPIIVTWRVTVFQIYMNTRPAFVLFIQHNKKITLSVSSVKGNI